MMQRTKKQQENQHRLEKHLNQNDFMVHVLHKEQELEIHSPRTDNKTNSYYT